MQKMKSIRTVLALVAGVAAISANANAQEKPAEAEKAGPPKWVPEAWESGEAPVVPANGPPAWASSLRTVEARRHQIYRKTRTESVAELVKLILMSGVSDDPVDR